jgi:hypothetical protein
MDTRTMIVWLACAVLAATVVCSPVACTISRQWATAEAIKAGADPISAKCAIEADTGQTAMCIVKAMPQ